MRKLIKLLIVACFVLVPFSCVEYDNYDVPGETFGGNFIIKGTNELFVEQNFQLKLEELSWSDNPTPFYIPIKPDGTFLNTKMFAGHYRVQPYSNQLPFWPIEPIEIDIKGKTYYDFEVVPYMQFKDVVYKVDGNNLKITFKMFPPKKDGLPKIIEIQPFVSLANRNSHIAKYSQDLRQTINKEWTDDMANTTYEIVIHNMSANIYFVKIGVRMNVGGGAWIYSLVNKTEGEKGYIKIEK